MVLDTIRVDVEYSVLKGEGEISFFEVEISLLISQSGFWLVEKGFKSKSLSFGFFGRDPGLPDPPRVPVVKMNDILELRMSGGSRNEGGDFLSLPLS